MTKELDQYIDEILFTEEEIKEKVRELGQKITADYKDDPADLLIVGILKGACVFMMDLIREIDLDLAIDFMSVSSYGDQTASSGNVRILKDLDETIVGKNLIIVEDIIDTGYTLDYLMKNFSNKGAKSVRIATLLNKPARRRVEVDVDYVGFDIPDYFIIGYGLDYAQRFRQLSFIATVNQEAIKE